MVFSVLKLSSIPNSTFLKCHLYLISVFEIQERRKSNGLKGLISAGENIENFFSDAEEPTIWLTMGDVTCGH